MAKQLPTEPGRYWWTTWNQNVDVYCKTKTFKPGVSKLYVKPSFGVEVQVTHRIAGDFRPARKEKLS